jgi:SsrA-binding protein
MKVVAKNKKAYHDYFIEDTVEAGLVLLGTEVKSLRDGRADLRDSYVAIREDEAYMLNCHISPYSHGNIENHEPTRTRKLLLSRREIDRLSARAAQKGYSLVPLRLYFKGPYAKVEVGLARGKRLFEKRETIKEREARKDIERALKTAKRYSD